MTAAGQKGGGKTAWRGGPRQEVGRQREPVAQREREADGGADDGSFEEAAALASDTASAAELAQRSKAWIDRCRVALRGRMRCRWMREKATKEGGARTRREKEVKKK